MLPNNLYMHTHYTYSPQHARIQGGGGDPDPDPDPDPPPPLEFAKLNIADITGNEKNSNFHICALPPGP